MSITPTTDRGNYRSIRQMHPRPILRITTCDIHNPKDAELGFVFGTDADLCDIVLDKNPDTSISRTQFAIIANWKTGVLLIRNHSTQDTIIDDDELGKDDLLWQRTLPLGETLLYVKFETFRIEIECPDHWNEYAERWKAYCHSIHSRYPDIQHINSIPAVEIKTPLPQKPVSARTLDLELLQLFTRQ